MKAFVISSRTLCLAALFLGLLRMSHAVDRRELFQWLEEAQEAQNVADKLRTHSRALEAILHADADLLAAALDAWFKEDGRLYSPFVKMTWARLTQLDEARALTMLEQIHQVDYFAESARAVHGVIAQKDPERAYAAVQELYNPKSWFYRVTLQSRSYLPEAILHDVGATWFRLERTKALHRLQSLSRPDDMATAVFEGFMTAATTVDERLALLDRLIGRETPQIHENHKSSDLCNDLVEAAAQENLAQTRTWIERRFPPGQKRASYDHRDWYITHARHALFNIWAAVEPLAAADWLMAQHGPDDPDAGQSLAMCARAITGRDYNGIAIALDWLKAQTRREDVIATIADWLDYAARDTNELSSRVVIARWMVTLPMSEREAILTKALKDCYSDNKPFRALIDDPLMTLALPELETRSQVIKRMQSVLAEPEPSSLAKEPLLTPVTSATQEEPSDTKKQPTTEPIAEKNATLFEPAPFSYEVVAHDTGTWMSNGFDVPAEHDKQVLDPKVVELSRELSQQHHLTKKADDPAERLAGLRAMRWMLEADPARLGPVLLAHLQAKQGEMSSFANDLIACWSLRDWRSCEQFAWRADLPASTRRNMLIQQFQEAAQHFPDAVLQRLRELIKTHQLSQDALNADGGGQAGPNLSYFCESITAGLAKGWTRQDDVAALSKIPTLPLKWQPLAYEAFSTEFTTVKAGLAMLDFIVECDARQPLTKEEKYCGLKWANWHAAQPVIRRLADIAPLSAKAWLEANPERLHEGREIYDGVRNVYTAWRMQDAQAADAWYWQHRPKDAMSTIINYALYQGDLDYATTLLKQHRDHPEYQMALASYAHHWREINPQEAARYVLQMKGKQRLQSAADLAHSWKRLDAKAASDFLDQAVPTDTPERLEVDEEIKRLDSYAWDTRK